MMAANLTVCQATLTQSVFGQSRGHKHGGADRRRNGGQGGEVEYEHVGRQLFDSHFLESHRYDRSRPEHRPRVVGMPMPIMITTTAESMRVGHI